jgi:antitoxin VapB
MRARTKLFKSNRTQALRLPKAVAFPDSVKEVEIVKVGNSITISPVGKSWDDFFDHGPWVSDDFMVDRNQPPPQKREPLD